MNLQENTETILRYQGAKKENRATDARKLAGKILEMNKGLIMRLAARFGRENDKDDAQQAASMGVLRAIEDFDPSKGAFSTHAGYWIRDYVQAWGGRPNVVKRPRGASMPAALAKEAEKIRLKFGRNPTAEELGVTEATLAEWSQGNRSTSLDEVDDEGRRFEMPDDMREEEHRGDAVDMREAMIRATKGLSDRNREILFDVFLDDVTQEEVATEYGVSKIWVRKLCERLETRIRKYLSVPRTAA